MTRKHFKALAYALWSVRQEAPTDVDQSYFFGRTVEAVANACQEANPNFDRAKFHDAVYGERMP